MTTVKIPAVPLSESDGSMGHKVERPRQKSESRGSFGAQVEDPAIASKSTVNGVTFVVPPGENQPK